MQAVKIRTMSINRKSSSRSSIKRMIIFWGGVIIFLAVLYLSVKYTVNSVRYTFFPVKEMIFVGNKHIADNDLKLIMELKGNEGLFELSTAELSEKLLKSPWIKSVSFRREFPNKFLVRVEETLPSAILEMNGRTHFIDDRGNLLQELKADSSVFLPIISGNIFKNSQTLSSTLELVRVIKEKGFINVKERIEIIIPPGSKPEEIAMQVDGTLIKIGYGEYENKIEKLLELEDEIARRGIPVDYIDLRFSKRVVVKPVNEVVK
ncbi:MAG: FtsQ-type POTRA domain-containing protein [Nitrospiraceae bacterium]|nr:FtsQ-type POTRA domain-containing protein [Nitrospiraceae bacterium]